MELGLSPADSAAVVTQVQGFVGPAVQAWLAATFKGAPPEVVGAIAKGATAGATVAVLAAVRWGLVFVSRTTRIGGDFLGPLWDRYKGVLNPLLAILLGHLDGSALAGALAVALHAGFRGTAKAIGNATPQGVSRAIRAGALLLVLGLGLGAAGPARAEAPAVLRPLVKQEPRLSAFARERFALSFALGAKTNGWSYSRGTQGFVEAFGAYQVTNALGLRVGVRRIALAGAPYEPEAKVVLALAP